MSSTGLRSCGGIENLCRQHEQHLNQQVQMGASQDQQLFLQQQALQAEQEHVQKMLVHKYRQFIHQVTALDEGAFVADMGACRNCSLVHELDMQLKLPAGCWTCVELGTGDDSGSARALNQDSFGQAMHLRDEIQKCKSRHREEMNKKQAECDEAAQMLDAMRELVLRHENAAAAGVAGGDVDMGEARVGGGVVVDDGSRAESEGADAHMCAASVGGESACADGRTESSRCEEVSSLGELDEAAFGEEEDDVGAESTESTGDTLVLMCLSSARAVALCRHPKCRCCDACPTAGERGERRSRGAGA